MRIDGDYLTLLRGGRFLLCVRYIRHTCLLAVWSTATGQQRFTYRGSGELLGFDREQNMLLLWDDEPRVHEIRSGRRLTITPAVIDSFEQDQRLRVQLISGERARTSDGFGQLPEQIINLFARRAKGESHIINETARAPGAPVVLFSNLYDTGFVEGTEAIGIHLDPLRLAFQQPSYYGPERTFYDIASQTCFFLLRQAVYRMDRDQRNLQRLDWPQSQVNALFDTGERLRYVSVAPDDPNLLLLCGGHALVWLRGGTDGWVIERAPTLEVQPLAAVLAPAGRFIALLPDAGAPCLIDPLTGTRLRSLAPLPPF